MKPIMIVNTPVQEKEIDWGVPMWMIHKDDLEQYHSQPMIILSNGQYSTTMFEGTVLPIDNWKNGGFSEKWSKSEFTPLQEPLTITISN